MADNTLSDDELSDQGVPQATDDEGSPRNTVEDNGADDDDDDLFGDGGGDDDDEPPARSRKLDDEDLDSGDDEGRTDRVAAADAGGDDEGEEQTYSFMDTDLARHPVPEPSDGELYLFKVPRFLAIEPKAFDHKTFQAPTTDHHSKTAASEHFSAYNTAMTTIRWRRSPTNLAELQSNARVLRWSDGSLTLQFANDPQVQFEINANSLAPPQINPRIPTPTSVKAPPKNPGKEAYTYLVAPYEEANVMRVTNKFTTGLSVVPAANLKDAAIEKLQNDLAAAASRGRDEADQAISFVKVDEDPELRRQREETAFKLKMKSDRAKEKQEQRQAERQSRAYGRNNARSSGYGLSIGGLEDEEGGGRGGRKPRGKTRQGFSDDDEDFGIRGKTREDDYDEDDDFIAASDEEPEIVEDDDDPDEGIYEESRHRKAASSPKRNRGGYDDDDDDDEEVVVSSRSKRRRVVEDDDESE